MALHNIMAVYSFQKIQQSSLSIRSHLKLDFQIRAQEWRYWWKTFWKSSWKRDNLITCTLWVCIHNIHRNDKFHNAFFQMCPESKYLCTDQPKLWLGVTESGKRRIDTPITFSIVVHRGTTQLEWTVRCSKNKHRSGVSFYRNLCCASSSPFFLVLLESEKCTTYKSNLEKTQLSIEQWVPWGS